MDKDTAGRGECRHEFEACVVDIGDAPLSQGVGRYALGRACRLCGCVDEGSLEFRAYGAGGALMRFAVPGDFGEGLPVVVLRKGA